MVRLSHDFHAASCKLYSGADQAGPFALRQLVELASICGQADASHSGIRRKIDQPLQTLEIDEFVVVERRRDYRHDAVHSATPGGVTEG